MSTQLQAESPFGPVVARPSVGGAVSESVVQREVTEVQTAYLMAQRFPRDPIAAMDRILQAFARPKLAESAVYEYSKGGSKVDGPSIRCAEALAQNWGNMMSGISIMSSKPGESECVAYAVDLETRYRDEKKFTVRHWRDKKGGTGYMLTDEREIYELCANMGARRKRACILAVLPSDVVEAALDQVEVTMRTNIEITPELIKSLIAAFEKFGVTTEQLEKRIQRRIDSITPALVVQLKKIQTSLKDNMSKPEDWFDPPEGQQEEQHATRTESVKAKVKAAVAPVDVVESSVLDPITDEAKALLALDASKDEGEGGAVLDRCKGQPFRARIVAAFNAKFPKTFG